MLTPMIALTPLPMIMCMILFISQRTHLLMVLLATESLLLTLTAFTLMTHCLTHLNSPFLIFLLLSLGACEAALGLAILVAMSRSFGSDLLSSLSTNKC